MVSQDDGHDAWNPGLESTIPARLVSAATLYRPENSHTSPTEAREAGEFCGCPAAEMVDFTFDRLVIHEVLIRATADLHVPDGPVYEELGVNLRRIADRIMSKQVAPNRDAMRARYEALLADLDAEIAARLEQAFAPPPAAAPAAQNGKRPGLLGRLFGAEKPASAPPPAPRPDDRSTIAQWAREAAALPEGVARACLEALASVCNGILSSRGTLPADRDLIANLARVRARNSHGSASIGEMIDPLIREAAARGEYTLLPAQEKPVILNVKGASASGKSTLRNYQRELIERLGIDWNDFALVSPDYWRKYLLDYDSLGPDYKYAAMLTGQELELIDRKLDSYFARKAARGEMPHLLIDRFRFDSFSSSDGDEDAGNMLSRFGDRIFIFFMITSPADTVERAWRRGKTTGRYKAVDDLLFHNLEAYAGMPTTFFIWFGKKGQKVHFEFLDNGVPLGERPLTVAYGWNGRLTVLNPGMLRRISDYRNIHVEARNPDEVLVEGRGAQQDFLADCVAGIDEVVFADPKSREVLGHTIRGRCVYERDGFFDRIGLSGTCGGRQAVGSTGDEPPQIDSAADQRYLVGAWPED